MRIGVIGLLHESNTFIAQPTTIEHFRQNLLLRGGSIVERFSDAPHELGGFLAGCREADCQAVPLVVARAFPFGTIAAETFDTLVTMIWREIEAAGPLDGPMRPLPGLPGRSGSGN